MQRYGLVGVLLAGQQFRRIVLDIEGMSQTERDGKAERDEGMEKLRGVLLMDGGLIVRIH